MGSINTKALEASYLLSLRIAKTGKPHSIAENLLLPDIKDVVKSMFSNKLLKDVDLIHLSDDTVGLRINDMARDVESQLIERVKKSPYYALQTDETTDVAVNMLHKIRAYNNIHDDILFCRTLSTQTTGEELFHTLNNYIRDKGIQCENVWATVQTELAAL
jgi:hypothetical protein